MEAKRLRLVATDFAGDTVWETHQKLTPPASRRKLIEVVLTFIGKGLKEIRGRYRNVLGIGLAANGIIDARRGLILHYDLVPAATDMPLRDLVAAGPVCPAAWTTTSACSRWPSG